MAQKVLRQSASSNPRRLIHLEPSGKLAVLKAQDFPPMKLSSSKNYILDLVDILTFNSIPSMDKRNNKFYVDG